MTSHGSVTRWLNELQAGDPAAAQQLWERFSHEMVRLARAHLRGVSRRVADESDVALSAFESFCRNAERGRFPQLSNRDDLWRLLIVIVVRKARHLRRDQGRERHGGHVTHLQHGPGASPDEVLAEMAGSEPTPALAAELAEQAQRLLDRLGSAELRQIAIWKMEGYTNEEIATRMDCAPRTVERKLQRIRKIWETVSSHDSDAATGG